MSLPAGVGYAEAGREVFVTQRGWWAPPFTSCMLASYCMVLIKQGYTLPLKRLKDAYAGTDIVNLVLALHRATGRPLDSGTTIQDTVTAVEVLWPDHADRPPLHNGVIAPARLIEMLNEGATIRVTGGPLSALPLSWNLPAGHGSARHALVLDGARRSPTTGRQQVFLRDPMGRPSTGYIGQWVRWRTLYEWLDKRPEDGFVVCTWGMPGEALVLNPDDKPQPLPPPPPTTGEDMPALANYMPGSTVTVKNGSNVRTAPQISGRLLRTTQQSETWIVIGMVKGDATEGTDLWLTRWSGGWEYTHLSNGGMVTAPPTSAELKACESDRETLRTSLTAATNKIRAAKAALG